MVEEEKFFAWLDGELPPEEAARVAAEVAADPELSRMAEEHRAMAAGLRGAFGSRRGAARARTSACSGADKRSAGCRTRSGTVGSRRERATPLWAQLTALAATLAVGVFAGNMLTGGMSGGPIQTEAGQARCFGRSRACALCAAGKRSGQSGPRIGLTFRDKTGAICRTFEDRAASGFACREGGDWRIRSLFQGPEARTTDYRMASGGDPQLMEAVDASIDGEPFDAAQERAAAERGWN